MSVSEAAPATHETNIVTETEPVADEQVIDETTKRVRVQTEKGRELYHANEIKKILTTNSTALTIEHQIECIEHKKSLDASWDKVEALLMKLPTCEQTTPGLRELETDINKAFMAFSQVSEKYVQFLKQVNSDESRVEKGRHLSYYDRTKNIVDRK